MNMRDYKTAALRTASAEFHDKLYDRNVASAVIGKALNAAAELDVAKKGLYYGKPTPKKVQSAEGDPGWGDLDKDLLHAALGLVTESAEFLEKVLQGADRAALISELGDQLWYANIATRPLGTDLGQVAKLNIDKLAKRYPEKFSLDAAVNKSVEDEDGMIADQLSGRYYVVKMCEGNAYANIRPRESTWTNDKEKATKFADEESARHFADVFFPGILCEVVDV
jgi:NTP pyrophosphatase (non-canonical NTP hydrolase)